MWKSLPFFLGVVAVAVGQQILVDDLELETEIGKYESPSDITFTKDGTLWACNKRGILTVSAPGDYDDPKRVLDLRDQLCENGERGLLGVAPHPDFGADDPYVYIMYTYKKNGNCNENGNNGPVMRLSRFTCEPGGDCDINTEQVFLESPSFPFDHHNAGAIAFGKDGLIYATIGDGGESPTAQDRTNLFGVVVRLTPDNKIPEGNPYSVESGHDDSVRCGFNGGESGGGGKRCQEIFAYGLRNPFRMSMNPNKGKTEFHVNDVGASLWEEVSVGGDGYKGANYGWPIREGPCKKGSDCGRLCNADDTYVEPEYFYHHDDDDEGAITAGTFVPEGIWPEAYDGKYLYADYVFGSVYVMDPTGNEDRDVCPMTSNYDPVPLIRYSNAHISAMAFNPIDNSLYFLTRGFGGRLSKISHVGLVNRAPQPKIKTSALGGEVGTTIEFDASESTDPDGHSLSFEWDFDGDGEVDSRDKVTTFQYNKAGIYEVTLKVRDGYGSRPTTTIDIGIGAHPEAEILEPAEGSDFFVGQEFDLTGSATGPGIEDDDDSFSWEVKQHHGNHFHPYLEPTKGNPVKLQAAPSPEDFLASENSYLEVILTVTNAFGLKTTVSRNVMPRLRQVSLYSVPANRTILVDNYEVTTPMLFTSWANHPLKLEATDSDWVEWSNEGDQSQVTTLSQTNEELVTLVAYFSETGAPATPGPTTSAPTSLAPTTLSPTTLQPTTMAPTVPPTMPPTFANRNPVAKITTSALGGDVGRVIEFDASQSTDLDNDEMVFEWDFDGDGETDSSQPLVTFQYNEAGIYTVTLTVRDGDGGFSTSSVDIGIGQYPTAEILEPFQGSQFHVGEVLVLKGTAGGAGISSEAASMNWMVNQHFGDFFVPILLWTNGNNIELPPAPTPEQLLASENSHWEIILTVTNRFGISTTVTRDVTPQLLSVTVTSDPPGRVIRVDSFYVTTPTSFVSWANQDLVLQAIDTDWYGWSDGGEQTHVLTLGDSSATADADDYSVVAFFEPLTGPPVAAPSTPPVSGFNTADGSSSSVVVPSGLIVATLLATIVLGIH